MEQIIIEIRAAEGGQDSKLLVEDLRDIYLKTARTNNFDYKVVNRDGFTSIWLTGKGVKKLFRNESGAHRWLRVPPTEKRGRTQTSIITIALVDPNDKLEFSLNRNEVDKQYTRSSGKGGQNVNKVSSCVILTHRPTGIQIKCQDTRDQYKNEEIAWQRLEDKLKSIEEEKWNKKVYQNRLDQVGSGSRSDKKRSYRIKEDLVIDHETGKQCSFKDFSRGKLELLS